MTFLKENLKIKEGHRILMAKIMKQVKNKFFLKKIKIMKH